MNLAKRRAAWLLAWMVLACAAMGPAARGGAADTAFTYQGQLKENGAPANGLHDFRFRLFDAASEGAQVGPTLCADNVDVVNGLFTVPLDFGQQYATTAQRHLEIQVRRDIGQPCTDDFGYVLLSPRQQLTATPLASHAKDAFHADAAFALDASDGGPLNAVFVDNAGNVGIGAAGPNTKLTVWTPSATGVREGIRINNPVGFLGNNGSSLVFSQDRDPSEDFVNATVQGTQELTDSSADGYLAFSTRSASAVAEKMRITSTGFVGIGTGAPQAMLDVRGNITSTGNVRLGQLFATGGEENLRIVRGKIHENGPDVGLGFSVSHPGTGDYTITFNPPFASPPVVTASVEWHGLIGVVAAATPQVHSASTVSVVVSYVDLEFLDTGLANLSFFFIAVGPR